MRILTLLLLAAALAAPLHGDVVHATLREMPLSARLPRGIDVQLEIENNQRDGLRATALLINKGSFAVRLADPAKLMFLSIATADGAAVELPANPARGLVTIGADEPHEPAVIAPGETLRVPLHTPLPAGSYNVRLIARLVDPSLPYEQTGRRFESTPVAVTLGVNR